MVYIDTTDHLQRIKLHKPGEERRICSFKSQKKSIFIYFVPARLRHILVTTGCPPEMNLRGSKQI
jgi:hypothetical protein